MRTFHRLIDELSDNPIVLGIIVGLLFVIMEYVFVFRNIAPGKKFNFVP